MKILVIRFSSIGDIVLTSPVLRALKSQVENAEVHFLTKETFRTLIESNPNVDKIHVLKDKLANVVVDLKAEKFDVVIDLHNNIRTKRVKNALNVKSYTFQKLNLKKWLLTRFKIDKMPSGHVVDRYFEACKEISVKNDSLPGEFYIDQKDVVDTVKELNLTPKKYYSIAIGAQFATKQMPEELLVKIIEELELPVVLIGGPMDAKRGQAIVEKITANQAVNCCGNYSLKSSASLVIQSKKLLTGDTGMMHIAACFDVTIISVWGNTVPAFGMFPYKPNHREKYSIHEVKNLSCRPCSKIGFNGCPKKHFNCMQQQDVNRIVKDLIA